MQSPKMSATYSPDDNKLRLYASKLDSKADASLLAAGFIWAPKKSTYIAQCWTPSREDVLLGLCGEIGLESGSDKQQRGVRIRRIKRIEANKRKYLRIIEDAERFLNYWNHEGLTLERALNIASLSQLTHFFPPPEIGKMCGVLLALEKEVISVETAKSIECQAYGIIIKDAQRWIAHYDQRLCYERAMLEKQGGWIEPLRP